MSDSDDIYGRPQTLWAKIRTALVGVLVGMLVLAFAVWGIEDVFSPNSSGAIVKVGKAEVGQTEFRDAFQQRMLEFAEQNGTGLTNQQAFDRGLPQQLVQEMTRDLAIEADAQDLGVDVNNRDVSDAIENIEAFRNPITGEFDEDTYRRLLASNRLSEARFEADIVNTLTQRQTLPAVMGGIRAPSDYATRYNTFVNEIRSGKVLRLDETALDSVAEPTEAEIQSYVAANKDRFTAPEYRQVLMIRQEPVDFELDIEIDDAAVRERFDTLVSVGELGSIETRNVSIIPATNEAQASLIATRIAAGETVDSLVAELDLPAPDRFENVKPDGLLNTASSGAAFELEAGAAKAVTTDLRGFEVVVVDQINAAEVPDFEAEVPRLRQDLVLGQARRELSRIEGLISDALLDNKNLETIAKELELPIQALPFIDRTGTTRDGIRMAGTSRIPGIATDNALLNEIFGEDIGFESDVVATTNNGLAIFRVIDVIDPVAKPLEEVRETVVAELREQAVETALTELGAKVAARITAGEDLEAVANEVGATVEPLAIQRFNPPRQYSPAVLVGLLDGQVGTVARGRGVATGTYEVGQLDGISSSAEKLGGQALESIRQQVTEEVALDISQAYQEAVLTDKEYTVFDDQLRRVLGLSDDGL